MPDQAAHPALDERSASRRGDLRLAHPAEIAELERLPLNRLQLPQRLVDRNRVKMAQTYRHGPAVTKLPVQS